MGIVGNVNHAVIISEHWIFDSNDEKRTSVGKGMIGSYILLLLW